MIIAEIEETTSVECLCGCGWGFSLSHLRRYSVNNVVLAAAVASIVGFIATVFAFLGTFFLASSLVAVRLMILWNSPWTLDAFAYALIPGMTIVGVALLAVFAWLTYAFLTIVVPVFLAILYQIVAVLVTLVWNSLGYALMFAFVAAVYFIETHAVPRFRYKVSMAVVMVTGSVGIYYAITHDWALSLAWMVAMITFAYIEIRAALDILNDR